MCGQQGTFRSDQHGFACHVLPHRQFLWRKLHFVPHSGNLCHILSPAHLLRPHFGTSTRFWAHLRSYRSEIATIWRPPARFCMSCTCTPARFWAPLLILCLIVEFCATFCHLQILSPARILTPRRTLPVNLLASQGFGTPGSEANRRKPRYLAGLRNISLFQHFCILLKQHTFTCTPARFWGCIFILCLIVEFCDTAHLFTFCPLVHFLPQ